MRRTAIVALSVLLVAVPVLAAYWHFTVQPALLWHRSLAQVSTFQMAITRYNEKHTNQPSSIEVLVNDKLLPKVSSIYASALKYQQQIPKPVPYLESDYEIFVDGADAIVRLKPAVSNQVIQISRLRNLNLRAISARVDPESRVVYPPDPMKNEGR